LDDFIIRSYATLCVTWKIIAFSLEIQEKDQN